MEKIGKGALLFDWVANAALFCGDRKLYQAKKLMLRQHEADEPYPFGTERGRALLRSPLGRRYIGSDEGYAAEMRLRLEREMAETPYDQRLAQMDVRLYQTTVLTAIEDGVPPMIFFKLPGEAERIRNRAVARAMKRPQCAF